MKKFINIKNLFFFLIIFTLLIIAFFLKNNNNEKINTPKINQANLQSNTIASSFEDKKMNASKKGINWLITNSDKMSPIYEIVTLMYFYKSTPDENLANSISKIIIDKINLITHANTKFNKNDNKLLIWRNLTPILYELKFKKCTNQDYKQDLENFEEFLKINKLTIFPKTMNKTEKLIAAYQLKYLDIYLDNFYSDVIYEIRSSIVPQDTLSKEYYEYLFAITHIALTESGYLNKYLNPDDYPIEVKALNSSLDHLIKLDAISEYQTDIISEVLFSLQIFNIESNEKTNVLFQKLMTIQNPDGSWGKSTLIPNTIPHNTQTASLALMRFNDKFRGPHEYCELKNNIKIN